MIVITPISKLSIAPNFNACSILSFLSESSEFTITIAHDILFGREMSFLGDTGL